MKEKKQWQEPLDFEAFVSFGKELMERYMQEDGDPGLVEREEIQKVNYNYTALIPHWEDAKIAPMIDMTRFFEIYQSGVSLASIMKSVLDTAFQPYPEMMRLDPDLVTDYKRARQYLGLRVCNRNTNQDLLLRVPHKVVGDIAICCALMVEDPDHTGCRSMIITYDTLGHWEIPEELLFIDAEIQGWITQKPVIREMSSFMKSSEIPEEEQESQQESEQGDSGMKILCGKNNMYGAGVLFLDGMLEKLSEEFQGNYYVLPSSVHEFILLPEGEVDPLILKLIVREINEHEVPKEDWLSNEVYYYDADMKTLDLCPICFEVE